MIKYTDSNVFNSNCDAIVNTINCVGFMGKGIALEFAYRYPNLLKEYQEKCKNNEIEIGKIYYYEDSNKLIVNFPTKKDYKYSSKLIWIENGLQDFVKTYKKYNIKKIAFPPLGCGNGGLDRNIVFKLMEKYLSNLDIEIVICLDKINPEGKELEMINTFKEIDIEELNKYIKLSEKQKNNLSKCQRNIRRFHDIQNIDGIGITTYKNIHNLFYNDIIKINNIEKKEQLSIF